FGVRICDVDPKSVAHDGPVYDRPYARPAWQDALNADTSAHLPRPATGPELKDTVLALLSSPNLCSKSWVTDQYDRFVQGNTALAQPDDAGVIRVDETTGLGVALATDANGRYAQLDPATGAQLALAEAYRNVAASGARPLAITDCLNIGSPERPDSMWQLVQVIEGLAAGCAQLGVPVTGGNVSLYNTTGDRAIHPTPVVGVLGVLDDVADAVGSGWTAAGRSVYLLGTTRAELDGSAWAEVAHQHLGGLPPAVDLEAERHLAQVLVNAARDHLVDAAHDLSQGGLAQGLAEASLRHGIGARVDLTALCARDGVTPFEALFSESQARALVAVPRSQERAFVDLCTARGVPALRIGETTETCEAGAGEAADSVPADHEHEPALEVQGLFTLPLATARDVFEAPLRAVFG
ncbi:MAG: phosphoribosylformylglycinamidine synthase II, partial [Actinobacteria bacterium]|nr:phosphoribosylformylglycinamidine synthase II [Actinomycetota bacterium]